MEPFFDRIAASAGWDVTAAGPAPIVAVIDTGFALSHQDLEGRWALNAAETAGGATDADGDGYIGNWRGWDFVHNAPDPLAGRDAPTSSAAAHGTRTAGLAGLLNPGAKLLPLQALDDTGSGYTDDVAAAVRYAADHGAKVISLSLGSTNDDPYLHAQITYAISKGAVVTAAAGNDGCDCLLYPAAYPEVLAVGASKTDDTPAGFSSYGEALDVLAPGASSDFCTTNYSSTNATTGYGCSYAGTSYATPIVAGLAALLAQACPSCTNVDIITAISLGSEQLSNADGALHTATTGYGRINVARSLAQLALHAQIPQGQLVSKHDLSLSSLSLRDGPLLDSACAGLPGATCALTFQGPQGQTIQAGQKSLDLTYGTAVFYWNASTLGLAPGQWKIMTTITANGTSASTLADLITVRS
jgi:subtilisin family serine protease